MTPLARRLPGLVARALAFGALASGAVALRVAERGEAWTGRKAVLLVIAFLGGTLAGLLLQAAFAHSAGWSRSARIAALTAGAPLAFAGATYLVFAVWHIGFREVETDRDTGIHLFDLPFRMIDALGFFLITGSRLFLPWSMLAVAGAAGLWGWARTRCDRQTRMIPPGQALSRGPTP